MTIGFPGPKYCSSSYKTCQKYLGPRSSPETEKGGIMMGPEVYMLMGLSLIDLWWWLRK